MNHQNITSWKNLEIKFCTLSKRNFLINLDFLQLSFMSKMKSTRA